MSKKRKRRNHQPEKVTRIGRSADEVEFGQDLASEEFAADEVTFGGDEETPRFAADEVEFDRELASEDPGLVGAVNVPGAGLNEPDGGEELQRKHRDDRLRQAEDIPGQPDDVEAATEMAPAPDTVNREGERGEDLEETQNQGNGLGTISIILSVLSFFFVPFLLGSAGIVLGIISGRRGSVLGWWAVGLGVVSVILTAFIAPIAGF
ncbi:DUF4190 domain-containing protein [Melghirimyces algeriensis]|uniref:DUF4190 domain-containing protein n=1 Tax=Melghirimyces algeriensis TaxID=910412 RepID=A0A521BRN2_9BACL|nr:DUF4190 domain-containing protein [Melghirimyces algeriensis]SMO49715.1 hypothetical protein SAMN06264849_102340 [Melghirimyces algeriensis]